MTLGQFNLIKYSTSFVSKEKEDIFFLGKVNTIIYIFLYLNSLINKLHTEKKNNSNITHSKNLLRTEAQKI